MKFLLAIFLFFTTTFAWAEGSETPPHGPLPHLVVVGKILEIQSISHFSYLRLKTQKQGEIWAVVLKAPLKKGETVTISHAKVLRNFHSDLLKRSFDRIVLGALTSAH